VTVEVVLHTRFTRRSGPLALGDLVYSTTLLPGEKVRLATTDRRSRFSFDSETNLAWRSEQISEEQYRMAAFRSFMSDATSIDRVSDRASEAGSWDFHGDASGSLGFLSASADTNARGSHNARSARDYLGEHRAHAQTADHQSVEATRKAHSLSVGEVSTRTHSQGESEDHWESSSREFANANQCHAVTYFFYRINKTETVTFTLESIERRVVDPATPLPIARNPVLTTGQVSVIPQAVPATAKDRLDVEDRGLQSEIRLAQFVHAGGTSGAGLGVAGRLITPGAFMFEARQVEPLPDDICAEALAAVDAQLVAAGLIEADGGAVSRRAQEEFGFKRTTSLPTAGVIVKGCLDDCDTCESTLERSIQLDLERKELENKLLARQIELLDKAQEYRCCPGDEQLSG